MRVGLALTVDDTPPRHAEIVNWPAEKARRKMFALELAKVAALCVNEHPQMISSWPAPPWWRKVRRIH
jgi:hypothetical protein